MTQGNENDKEWEQLLWKGWTKILQNIYCNPWNLKEPAQEGYF